MSADGPVCGHCGQRLPYPVCDNCGERLHRDRNEWWVGEDGTSDCPATLSGHLVNGQAR